MGLGKRVVVEVVHTEDEDDGPALRVVVVVMADFASAQEG